MIVVCSEVISWSKNYRSRRNSELAQNLLVIFKALVRSDPEGVREAGALNNARGHQGVRAIKSQIGE
jgi:hypothetical protein